MDLGLAAALGAMLCWGVGDFLIQRSVRTVGDVETLAIIGLVGSAGLLPFVLPELLLLWPVATALLLALGVLALAVSLVNFESFKKGKLSVVDVVLEAELPLTVALGVLLFQEVLSVVQMALMSLIFAGIVAIAARPGGRRGRVRRNRGRLEKGVALALAAAAGMALVNALTATGARTASPLLAIWIPWLVVSACCLLIIWRREGLGRLKRNALRHRRLLLAMGTLDTLAWLFYAFAVLGVSLSVATAITESYPVIAVLLGYSLNKERLRGRQWGGVAAALAGSVLLAVVV